MDATVRGAVMPLLASLETKLAAEGRETTIDGVRVFDGRDHFLPGKIAIGLSYLLTDTDRADPAFAQRIAAFRRTADMTVDDPNDTWGIYYYVEALWRLKQAGLLEAAVSPQTLARLRTQLDWRRFVRPDLTLIDLPNNYYGVALSVARLRYLLGWEGPEASEALLGKAVAHYEKYSAGYGFADETDGEGRFDRYSVLLAGELAQRFIETGMAPPPQLKTWLRRSVDVILPRLNETGEGFEYGRSIGPYGETAYLEVLTAAAVLGMLTPEEQRMAYAWSCRTAARFAGFWIDPKMGSVNMWEGGRRTDAYRNKGRILGENLSLAHQLIYTSALWNRLGFKNAAADPAFPGWLKTLPARTVTWFARGEHDRALITLRLPDAQGRTRVISLPLINGGAGQHMNNPYFPAPFSPGMLSGVADSTAPNLVPRLTMADGSRLMPLAWFQDIRVRGEGGRTTVTYALSAMDRMGEAAPQADKRLSSRVTYVFAPGRITRIERYTPASGTHVRRLEMEFATFSARPSRRGAGRFTFAQGAVRSFQVEGAGRCLAVPVEGRADYRTPVGPLKTVIRCQGAPPAGRPFTVKWTLTY